MSALLEIADLNVRFDLPDGEVHAVKDASLVINPGECLGVVGESGSGKSQLFLAAFGLLAANGRASGSVKYRGEEILGASQKRLNALRGDNRPSSMTWRPGVNLLPRTLPCGGCEWTAMRRSRSGWPWQ